MLSINTMRYGTDEFVLSRDITGLVFQDDDTWDCSGVSRVTGFNVTYDAPVYTGVKIAFIVDNVLYKLDTSGNLVSLDYTGVVNNDSSTYDMVYKNGNWPTDLTALSNVPGFVGKKVRPVIALFKADGADRSPSIQMSLKCVNTSESKTKEEITQAYDLNGYYIYKVVCNIDTTSGGTLTVEAALLNNAEWSDWIPVANLKGQSGDQIKFRLTYGASTIGSSSAKLKALRIQARRDAKSATSLAIGNTEIITKEQSFKSPMSYVRAYVVHGDLKGSRIRVFVNLADNQSYANIKDIGTGTGAEQTVTLSDSNIDFTSINLYQGQIPIMEFGYDTEANTVTFTAEAGTTIYASYKYGKSEESWKEMEEAGTETYVNDPAKLATYYVYAVSGEAKTASSVKIKLEQKTGSVTNEVLGTANGLEQVFLLDNEADPNSIVIKMNGLVHSTKNWSYDEDSQSISVIGIKGREFTADYTWVTEPPSIKKFAVAWNR